MIDPVEAAKDLLERADQISSSESWSEMATTRATALAIVDIAESLRVLAGRSRRA